MSWIIRLWTSYHDKENWQDLKGLTGLRTSNGSCRRQTHFHLTPAAGLQLSPPIWHKLMNYHYEKKTGIYSISYAKSQILSSDNGLHVIFNFLFFFKEKAGASSATQCRVKLWSTNGWEEATMHCTILWRAELSSPFNTTEAVVPGCKEQPHGTQIGSSTPKKHSVRVLSSCNPANSSRKHFHELTGMLSDVKFTLKKSKGYEPGPHYQRRTSLL